MGIFDDLFGNDKTKSGQALGFFAFVEEQEKEDKNLAQQQKNLVKNGKYDKTSFEEDDLEEDDYYYEDE